MAVPMLSRRALRASVVLAAFLTLLLTATALAAPPAITLDKSAPDRQLYGTDARVTLHAANPAGQPYGYNLTFRDVLPAGIAYVPGSAPFEPHTIANAPGLGQTTLIWENVSDLSPNSSYTLAYEVSHSTATRDVGDTYTNQAGAYIHEDPRFIPDFDTDGEPIASPSVSSATDSAITQLTALDIEKLEPSPEGELLRGVHDHKTVYTLRLRNNDVNPTTDVTLDDWLPAGLEYLACATADNSSALEFPGAPALDASAPAAPFCVDPTIVETVFADPDGGGPLPAGVYTHVRWEGLPPLAPGDTYDVQYVAAVPIFENTLDFGGLTPTPGSGLQAANLDNNQDVPGAETFDEQELTNFARASGVYEGSVVVFDETTLTRTAEDIAIQKSVDTDEIVQGGISEWTLDIEASEYRSVANIRVTDTLPDGLCPLGQANYEATPPAASSMCDPVLDVEPNVSYSNVQEQADGSFVIDWIAPDLGPSQTTSITFPTRTRAVYQQNFADDPDRPVLTRDTWRNEVDLLGTDSTPAGIPHQEPDGTDDADDSAASQEAGEITIDKTVAAPDEDGDCPATGYVDDSAQAFGPGDRVCWRVRVEFPGPLDTGLPAVQDFLPAGAELEPGSVTYPGSTVPAPELAYDTVAGPLTWDWASSGDDIDAGDLVFQAQFSTILGEPDAAAQGDILGNLQKVVFSNSAGTTFPLRDQATFAYEEAVVDLVKGVADVNDGPANGPDTDGVQVNGGDVVTYRLDLSNAGTRAASAVEVWDLLPDGITCGMVDEISPGGTCTTDRIEWTGQGVPGNGATTLTYDITIPTTFGPSVELPNRAGVRAYASVPNIGGAVPYVPENNIDPTQTATNAPPADDTSIVTLDAVGVVKTRDTSIEETGNAEENQATIGETIRYTVTTTIPSGTTLYGTPTFSDPLGTRQTLVPGSVTVRLNGADPGYAVSTAGNTVTVAFPATYANPSGDDELVVRFNATVDDEAENTREGTLPNEATFTYTDAPSGTVRTPADSVDTTIVEPNLLVEKTTDNDTNNRVLPGQNITYTVTASHAAGANRSPGHDVRMVDVVPIGLTPDPASITGGGVWNPAPGFRTITWNLGTVLPDDPDPIAYTYVARVDDPANAASTFPNTVTLTGTSIAGAQAGERTAASSTNAGYRSTSTQTMQIAAATVDKGVTPADATVGDEVTYTIDLLLRANVNYADVVVLDTLPDGMDFVPDDTDSVTCTGGGCSLGADELTPMPQGDGSTRLGWWVGDAGSAGVDRTVRITYTAHVDDTYVPEGTPVVRPNALTNNAQAAYNSTVEIGAEPPTIPLPGAFDETSNTDPATVTVIEPALTIDKNVSGDGDADDARPTQPGDTYTYTLRVENTGNAPAYDVRVTDQPDDDIVDVVLTTGAGVNVDDWTPGDPGMAWQVPTIAPGATVTLEYTAALGPSSDLTDGETIANTADVPSYWGVPAAVRTDDDFDYDYREYTNTPDDTVTLTVDLPQLDVVKTTGLGGNQETGDAEIGQAFPWRVVVTNTATTAVAHDVSLSDVLPADWSYVAGSASPALTTGAGGTLTWTDVTDLAPGASATFTFQAIPAEAAAAAPDPQVNTATATAEDGSGAGGYTDADTASATLRSPTLVLTKTPDGATRAAGEATSWTVRIQNTGDGAARGVLIEDTLPAGVAYVPGSATASPATGFSETAASGTGVTWELAELAPGATVDITVPVTIDASLLPPLTLTNTASASADEVTPPVSDSGSFALTTSADVGITKVGDVATIEAGTQFDYTLTVTNAGPSDARDVAVTDQLPPELAFVSAESPCMQAAGLITCALDTVDAGDTVELTVRVRVPPGVTGTVDNTAEVTTTTPDPNPANDEDTETTTIGTAADLSLTKTAAAPAVLQGGTMAYTVEVANGGPSDAVSVVVTDPLPTGATFVPADSDGRCAEAAGTVTCTIGELGESQTTDLVIVLRLDTVGTIVNTATVSSPTPDPDPGDRTDDASVDVAPATDLSAAKTGPATVTAGAEATYTLTAGNAGPSDATGVVLTDTLPAGTRFVDAAPSGACTEAGGVVTCPIGALASGAAQSVDIVVEVPVGLGDQTLLNSATVSGDQGDPNPANDTATATSTVGPAVDLRVTKTTPGAVAGGDVTWTVGVVNGGPSTATGVTLEDPLPAGVTFVAAVPGQGTCALDGTTVRCDLGTIARDGAVQVTITARVGAPAGTHVANAATAGSAEPEIAPPDNTGTATFIVAERAPDQVSLAVTKTASTDRPRLGVAYDYVIRTRNTGAVDAPAVIMTDALPAPLDLVSAAATQGTCDEGRVVRCALGTIPAGGEASVTIRVVPRRGGKIRNLATVDSGGTEATPDDLSSVAGVDVRAPRGSLRLEKRAGKRAVRAGGKVRFALVVRTGDRAVEDVRLCDVLPASMSVVAAPGAKLRQGRPCWSWGYLPANARRVVHVTVRVAPGSAGGSVRNTAAVRAGNARRRSDAARVQVRAGAPRGGGVTG